MFNERERAYEAKYQHEQELEFRAHARRDHLFGLWAAEKLGLSGDIAEAYARELVTSFTPHRDAAVKHKVIADLGVAGIAVNEYEVAALFDVIAARAHEEVAKEAVPTPEA